MSKIDGYIEYQYSFVIENITEDLLPYVNIAVVVSTIDSNENLSTKGDVVIACNQNQFKESYNRTSFLKLSDTRWKIVDSMKIYIQNIDPDSLNPVNLMFIVTYLNIKGYHEVQKYQI